MGLLDRWKKKEDYGVEPEKGKLYAPISGRYIPLQEIPDPVFAEGVMGQGCGIEPDDSTVYAPADGQIVSIAEIKHAIGILDDSGAELLIHVGMDTVNMLGEGFQLLVAAQQRIKCGQPLLKFDLDKISQAGYPSTTAFVVTNSDEYAALEFETGKSIQAKDICGSITTK